METERTCWRWAAEGTLGLLWPPGSMHTSAPLESQRNHLHHLGFTAYHSDRVHHHSGSSEAHFAPDGGSKISPVMSPEFSVEPTPLIVGELRVQLVSHRHLPQGTQRPVDRLVDALVPSLSQS